jgi:hypothetical protein
MEFVSLSSPYREGTRVSLRKAPDATLRIHVAQGVTRTASGPLSVNAGNSNCIAQ